MKLNHTKEEIRELVRVVSNNLGLSSTSIETLSRTDDEMEKSEDEVMGRIDAELGDEVVAYLDSLNIENLISDYIISTHLNATRCAFLDSELERDPIPLCTIHDEILDAAASPNPDDIGVICKRDGTPTNRYTDGVAGVLPDAWSYAEETDDVCALDNPNDNIVWADCVADSTGRILQVELTDGSTRRVSSVRRA